MSRLTDALTNLADIHAHLSRGEVYRGLQAKPVFVSGVLGLVAAYVQPQFYPVMDAVQFTCYWLFIACACALIGVSGALTTYLLEDDSLTRRRARIVVGQFLPCIAAGTFTAVAMLPYLDRCVGLLPGLWSLCYALGLFSARPYLPHAIGWVGFYFLVAGTLLLNLLPMGEVPSPWTLAGVFSVGQFGLAYVLHRNSVRENTLV